MTVRERDHRITELSHDELVDLTTAVHEFLWPKCDPNHPWDASTLSDVAAAFESYGLLPQ